MYQAKFTATDDADLPLAATDDAVFKLEVSDCGHAALTATSADSSITKPETGTIQWIIPASSMAGLCAGRTYDVGVTMTNLDGSVLQVLIGSLAVVNGGF